MKHVIRTPSNYIKWRTQPDDIGTPAMRVGTAFHHRILDRDIPDKIRIFTEGKMLKSKAGEKFIAEQDPGSICLNEDEYEQVIGMVKSIRSETMIMTLIERSQTELEIYGKEHTDHGAVPSKAKLDAITSNLIIDVKTWGEEALSFKRKFKYSPHYYHLQAAWYQHMAYTHLDGRLRDYYWIVVESQPPHGVLLQKAKAETLAEGSMLWNTAIQTYAKCLSTGLWPGYNNELIEEI
jgi:exodeoxyribonuclease VIII